MPVRKLRKPFKNQLADLENVLSSATEKPINVILSELDNLESNSKYEKLSNIQKLHGMVHLLSTTKGKTHELCLEKLQQLVL